MPTRWLADAFPASTEVHVVPMSDLAEHTEADCACGPETEPVFRDDGSNGWLVKHHSLDGRELHEPDG